MKKFWFQTVGLLIIIFGALLFATPQNFLGGGSLNGPRIGAAKSPSPVAFRSLTITDAVDAQKIKATVNVEVVDTKEKRSQGLSGRAELASNSGMLFVFQETDIPSFWMKNMLIPLDMIWIRGNEIVDFHQNVPPPPAGTPDEKLERYSPSLPIDKILEVNSGFVTFYQLQKGDKINLQNQ